MVSVLAPAVSHVPRPAIRPTITVTLISRLAPASAIASPMATNGMVLPIRWPKPACRKGELTTPGSASTSRGSMP